MKTNALGKKLLKATITPNADDIKWANGIISKKSSCCGAPIVRAPDLDGWMCDKCCHGQPDPRAKELLAKHAGKR